MRGRRFGRRGRAPRLDHDDRLGQRDFARRRKEGTRIADRFHVNHDAVGAGVIAEVVDQVAPVYVQHGADRDERTEADVLLQTPVQNRRTESAALADESHVAGPRNGGCESCVQTHNRVHHAEAVGTNQAHLAANRVHDLGFQLLAGLADFLETGRDHDGRGDAKPDRFLDQGGNAFRRRRDHHQVDHFRQIRQRGIGTNAENIRPFGIHWINSPAKLPARSEAPIRATL